MCNKALLPCTLLSLGTHHVFDLSLFSPGSLYCVQGLWLYIPLCLHAHPLHIPMAHCLSPLRYLLICHLLREDLLSPCLNKHLPTSVWILKASLSLIATWHIGCVLFIVSLPPT